MTLPMSERSKGLVAINIAAVIFGTAALFGKLDVSPVWIVAARAGFAAISLALIGLIRKRLDRLQLGQMLPAFGTGVLLDIHWLTFFVSVQLAGVAIATLTFATFPLFTVLIETAKARRKPHMIEILAGLAVIFAVLLLVDADFIGAGKLEGAAMGLLSGLSFAMFGIASQTLGRELSPLSVSVYQNAVVLAVLLPFLPFSSPVPYGAEQWFWLFMLGVVTTALMHQLYFFGLRRLSASTCSGFVALEPVYAILFAAALFSEPLTPAILLSAALIIGASFALLRQEAKGGKQV